MKRIVWIELIGILLSYVMVLNNLTLMALLIIAITTALNILVVKDFDIMRFTTVIVIGAYLMCSLANVSKLNITYEHFDIFLTFLSINIASFYEVVHSYMMKEVIRPYIFALLALCLFTIVAMFIQDNNSIMSIYPKGIFSLYALINMIFMPYIICLTLSFLYNEVK